MGMTAGEKDDKDDGGRAQGMTGALREMTGAEGRPQDFFCRQGWTSVSMIGMTIGTKQDNESTESGKKDVGIIVQKGCWEGP
ncbi:unnamed protein product [Sphagnum troendelagicum]|uniref:Uncharacterized protein n=1 Tax=Sphagnum troendelagicum TaxID=128251 RepID=A0ABP0T831_9BRYO